MKLNRIEFGLMNNPVRAAVQRHFEAQRLLRMGGAMRGGRALEIGCGRGVGTETILDTFVSDAVNESRSELEDGERELVVSAHCVGRMGVSMSFGQRRVAGEIGNNENPLNFSRGLRHGCADQ